MVQNNIIVINRGDSHEFDLTIVDSTSADGRYKLIGDDTVYFGIMDPHQMFENALVRKKFTVEDTDAAGNLTIVIEPEDTLDLLPGKYYYAVKLHLNHAEYNSETNEFIKQIDKVATVINKTKFIICD
jgi:hypothetical protein